MILRAVLGGMAVYFALMWGRSAMRLYRAGQPQFRGVSWALRTIATLLGVCWPGVDPVAVAIVVVAALAFAVGATRNAEPPRVDHLEKVMFPDEE